MATDPPAHPHARPARPSARAEPRSRSSPSSATHVALLPCLAKVAVDDGIVPGDLDALTVVVAVFLAAGIAARAVGGSDLLHGWVGERALADLRIQLFDHLQRLSLGYYERNRTGAIISRITNDVEALDQLVTDGISSLVQNSPCSWERRSSCSFSTGVCARSRPSSSFRSWPR